MPGPSFETFYLIQKSKGADFFTDASDLGGLGVDYEHEITMTEELYYPETIFDGLSFIGGLLSIIMGVFSFALDKLNKRQFDKKVLKFMLSKKAEHEIEDGPA